MVKCKFAGTYQVTYKGATKVVSIPKNNAHPVLIDGETTIIVADTILRASHAETLRGMMWIVCGNAFGHVYETAQDASDWAVFQIFCFGSPPTHKRPVCIFADVAVEKIDG